MGQVFVRASRRAKSYFRRSQKIQRLITMNSLRRASGAKRAKQISKLESRLYAAHSSNEAKLAKKVARGNQTSFYKKPPHPQGSHTGHGFAPTGFKPFGT